MKKVYKNFYGCTASITETREGARLICRTPQGKIIKKSNHKNCVAARSAMYRLGDGWRELK